MIFGFLILMLKVVFIKVVDLVFNVVEEFILDLSGRFLLKIIFKFFKFIFCCLY